MPRNQAQPQELTESLIAESYILRLDLDPHSQGKIPPLPLEAIHWRDALVAQKQSRETANKVDFSIGAGLAEYRR